MNLLNSLRPALLLTVLPAVLVFSACKKDDDKPTPAQARVLAVHAAPTANAPVKVLVDTKAIGSDINYTLASSFTGYTTVDAGSRMLYVNDAASNKTVASLKTTLDTNKNYSVFAYSPTNALGSVDILVATDDLAAPSAGKAKIRIVNLAVGFNTPVSLSLPAPTGGVTDIVPNVQFATASAFTEIAPAPYNLSISTGTGATATIETSVGDGKGTTTANRTYEAGKIYTVVLRGLKSNSVSQDLRLNAVVIQNN